MKTVIGISLGAKQQDFEFRTRLLGQALRVRRLGTDGDLAQAGRLLREWDSRADAVGLGLAKGGRVGSGDARRAARLRALVTRAPVSNGARLSDVLLEWAVRHAQSTLGHYFDNTKVLFFNGLSHQKLASTMSEYTPNLHFADPVLQLGAPKLLTSLDGTQPVCQRHALRGRLVAAPRAQPCAARAMGAARAAPCGAPCHGAGGVGARARRLWPGGAGGQDHRHPHRQRSAARGLQGQGRAPGHRRRADGARPCRRPLAARRHDPGRHRPPWRRSARRRVSGDPRHRGRCSRACCTRTASSA